MLLFSVSCISAGDTTDFTENITGNHDVAVEKSLEIQTEKSTDLLKRDDNSINVKDTADSKKILEKNVKDNVKNLPKKDLTITSDASITANVGDTVIIPFGFNDSVNEGKLSISYGGSVDNTISISGTTNSITFDTTGYLQGEYDLVLDYTDSSTYNDGSTSLTLYLYQPTSLTSDVEEVNVVLGNENRYQVIYVSSRDSSDNVIWGSIDVYVDDEIIDTLIVDDETENTASIFLDDYNLEYLGPGRHTLKAIFNADDPYITGSQTSMNLNIEGNVQIELPNNITALTKQEYNLPVNVTFNGKKVTSGDLSYYVNDELIRKIPLSSLQNGISRTANYEPGIYTIRLDYDDDDSIYPSASNSTRLIVRSNTTIRGNTLYNTVSRTTFSIIITDDWTNKINTTVNLSLSNGTRFENVEVKGSRTFEFPYLPAGENTLIVESPETLLYNRGYFEYNTNISKENSMVTASVTENTVLNTELFVRALDSYTSSPINEGMIEIVNTQTDEVVGQGTLHSDGYVSVQTNLHRMGNYSLRVDFKGNDVYNPSSKEINVTVVKLDTTTMVNVNNNTYGNTSVYILIKERILNKFVAYAPVTITLPNGSTVNITTTLKGFKTVPLNLPVGSNEINVEYKGNDTYNPSNSRITINVVKRQSVTTAEITNSSVNNVTVRVNVTDKTTGKAVTEGTVNISDKNGNNIGSGSIDNTGIAIIRTNITDRSIDEIAIHFDGNTNYEASSHTIDNLEVVGRLTEVTYTEINNTYNNISINISVKDPVTDEAIPDSSVIITYPDGTTETLTTDADGNLLINIDLSVGENNISVEVPATENYNATSTTITIDVSKRESITTATVTNNTLHNTTINIEVRDKTTGQSITSGEIEVINTDNDEIIATGTITSEENIITADLEPGSYNITIKYKGNQEYLPSQDTLSQTSIVKRDAELTITTLNNTINNTQITITVKDPVTGTTIENAPVKITLPDTTVINTNTGPTGTVTEEITLPAGTQTIEIEFTGNGEYNNTRTTYTINISKLQSMVTISPMTSYVGERITLTATITDKNEAPLTGGRVVFKLNDVTLKDNGQPIYAQLENGTATITYQIPDNQAAKSYKLSATYEGNSEYYNNRSNVVLLNLKQRQSKITVTCQDTLSVNEKLNLHVTVTDKQDNTRNINGYIIFKIDGKTLTDTNGETIKAQITNNTADYQYTLRHPYSARKHSLTAVLVNGSYVRSQANTSFNITRATTRINLNPVRLTKTSPQLTGTITDTNNNTVTGTNKIAVKIDGKTIKGSDGKNTIYMVEDGKINITLPVNPEKYTKDTYTIEVVTGQRNSYTGAKTTTQMTKEITKNTNTQTKDSTTPKEYVKIEATKTITTTQNTGEIELNIQDTYNKAINTGQVTFKHENKTLETIKVRNGQAKLNARLTIAGTYNITATYTDSTGTYHTTTKDVTITVIDTKTGVKILANHTKSEIGETITYTTLLLDEYNNPINTGTLTTTINNKTTTHQVKNGISTTTLTPKKTGTYTITIKYNTNKEYKDAQTTITITVTKKIPTITIQSNPTAGSNTTITATITTKKGVPLNEGKIQWKINGITLKNSKKQTIQTPINEGTSNITYIIPQTWAGKTINITATYTGTDNIQITSTTKNVTIPQLKTTATITIPTTIHTKDRILIKIKITDRNNNKTPIGTNKIAIKLNEKTIQTPTIQNGIYTLTYKLPLLKTNNTQKITVVHSNKYYARTETNKQFKIQKINTTLTLKDQKIKKNSTLHIRATVKDTNGEVMQRNDTYCVKVNGKTIHTSRLKNGLIDFKIPVNYKIGKTYNLTIKTTPNYYYNPITKTVKLTVTG